MTTDSSAPEDLDGDELVDLRVRVRRTFKHNLKLRALQLDQPLQTYVSALIKRGYTAERRSASRKRKRQSVPS